MKQVWLPLNVNAKCHAQYSWRHCVKIIDIPEYIVYSNLEKTVQKGLQHIGTDICVKKIELSHLSNKKDQSDDSEMFLEERL